MRASGCAVSAISLTGTGDPFASITQDARNVTTESRYYLGFDARYRIGNTSIEPGFIYLLVLTRGFQKAPPAMYTGEEEEEPATA